VKQEWNLKKACDCDGASKPGFPAPICCECGKPWEVEITFEMVFKIRTIKRPFSQFNRWADRFFTFDVFFVYCHCPGRQVCTAHFIFN